MGFKRATLREFRAELRRESCPVAGFSECYVFEGARGCNGYHLFRSMLPSTVSVLVSCGRFPLHTGHRCGNPNCVRFQHLGVSFFPDPNLVSRSKKGNLDWGRAMKILDARPASGAKYSYSLIATRTGEDPALIRTVLRLAPAFDIYDEVQRYKTPNVDMTRVISPLDDTAHPLKDVLALIESNSHPIYTNPTPANKAN